MFHDFEDGEAVNILRQNSPIFWQSATDLPDLRFPPKIALYHCASDWVIKVGYLSPNYINAFTRKYDYF